MILAWENLRRFLWCCSSFCCYSSFVDVFHFVVVSLFDFQATLPCRRHSTLAFQTCEGLHQLWALPQLLFIAFFFHLPQALRFWVGIFYPHTGVFYLMFFPNIFGTSQHFWHISDILAQPTFTKVLLGAGSHFLESCRASYWSSKHRPGPSLYLIQSNPQSFIHLTFLFMHVNIAKVFTCGENFDKKYRSAAKLISNHENIKQQPN